MSSRWDSIVSKAREIDETFASGRPPEWTVVMLLARAVLDFQQQLAGSDVTGKPSRMHRRNG